MTVSVQTSFVEYTGNGVTTVFPYTFRVDDSDYFVVKLIEIATLIEETLDYGVDYTASGIGNDNGGNITYNPGTPMAATHKLRIERILPLVQLLDIASQSGFNPEVLEQALDNMTMMIQQADAKASLDVAQYAVAAAASALAAGNSATAAAASASTASTAAGTATTGASTATTQAGIATTQASNASTSATNASNSASSASTSATNASNSASSASTSAAAAAAALASTLAAFDSFDDRYLGAKAADPTLDNDGDPLVAGMLYFNTGSGAMKVYTGSIWVAAYVSGTDFVTKLGDTMTGALVLSGDPTIALHATTKQYTDLRVLRAGDTMTGKLNMLASASGGAGLNLGQGADPSSPVNGDLWITASGLAARIAGSSYTFMPRQGGSFSGLVTFATPTTSIPSIRLPHGVAPSSPTDGDMWTTTAGLLARINGTSVTFSIVGHSHAISDVTNLQTTLDAKALKGQYSSFNNQTGTTYSFVLGDGLDVLCTFNNASPVTVTIPANSSVAFPIGTKIDWVNIGAGQVTFAITTDTLRAPDGTKSAKQYAAGSLLKIASTTWVLTGNVTT